MIYIYDQNKQNVHPNMMRENRDRNQVIKNNWYTKNINSKQNKKRVDFSDKLQRYPSYEECQNPSQEKLSHLNKNIKNLLSNNSHNKTIISSSNNRQPSLHYKSISQNKKTIIQYLSTSYQHNSPSGQSPQISVFQPYELNELSKQIELKSHSRSSKTNSTSGNYNFKNKLNNYNRSSQGKGKDFLLRDKLKQRNYSNTQNGKKCWYSSIMLPSQNQNKLLNKIQQMLQHQLQNNPKLNSHLNKTPSPQSIHKHNKTSTLSQLINLSKYTNSIQNTQTHQNNFSNSNTHSTFRNNKTLQKYLINIQKHLISLIQQQQKSIFELSKSRNNNNKVSQFNLLDTDRSKQQQQSNQNPPNQNPPNQNKTSNSNLKQIQSTQFQSFQLSHNINILYTHIQKLYKSIILINKQPNNNYFNKKIENQQINNYHNHNELIKNIIEMVKQMLVEFEKKQQ